MAAGLAGDHLNRENREALALLDEYQKQDEGWLAQIKHIRMKIETCQKLMQEIVGGDLAQDITQWESNCQAERTDQELQWLDEMMIFLEGQIRQLESKF